MFQEPAFDAHAAKRRKMEEDKWKSRVIKHLQEKGDFSSSSDASQDTNPIDSDS